MPSNRIEVPAFLEYSKHHLVVDVRSEGEYAHAHFPGAISMPLFNNEERKVIGTAYKQQSKQVAIKLGLDYFGKKMVSMVETVEKLLYNFAGEDNNKTVVVYCWRGGMRSGGVSWLLDLYGFKVYTLIGGYKAFRNWALQQLQKDFPLKVIGGFTGSGKTMVLKQLQSTGNKIIDLENLALHKGSAFGSLGLPKQPSQEMFENTLAFELHKLLPGTTKVEASVSPNEAPTQQEQNNTTNTIWIEDESQRIGLVNVPMVFYRMMRTKPLYFLEIPFLQRLQKIVQEYGQHDKVELAAAVKRIEKRLGSLEARKAIDYIQGGDFEMGFEILLKYYDKQYLKALQSRENLDHLLKKINSNEVDPPLLATEILNVLNLQECQTYN